MACPGVRPANAAPLRVYFAWHGNPSSPWFEHEAPKLASVLDAAASGAVAGVGVLKAGVEVALHRPGVRILPLYNFPILPPVLATSPITFVRPSVAQAARVGIFGMGPHKNVAAQVLAACSLGAAVEVHTNMLPETIMGTLAAVCAFPVVQHDRLSHSMFLNVLATMDIVSCESLVAYCGR